MKNQIKSALGVAIACLVVVFLASLLFAYVYPGGNGMSYVWIPWMAFPIFYMGVHPEKFLLTMLCSFGAGIVWSFLSGLFVSTFMSNAPLPLILFFTCGVVIALICFVHQGFLSKTPFSCLSAVFVANLLCTYDMYGAGSVTGELLTSVGYIRMFLMLAYGCLCTFILNRVAFFFIGLLCPPEKEQKKEN